MVGLRFKKIDWILLFFVIALIFFLFKYTDIPQKGVLKTAIEGYQNLKKIKSDEEKPIDSIEKEKRESLKNRFEQPDAPLFCQNNFFPFLPGAKWIYQIISKDQKDTLELGIPSPEGENYFIDGRALSLNNWTVRTLARCRDSHIVEVNDLNFFDLPEWKNVVTKPCEENKFYFTLPQAQELENPKNTIRWEEGCLERVFIDPDDHEKKTVYQEKLEVGWKIIGPERIKVPIGEYPGVKVSLQIKSTKGDQPSTEKTIDFWVVKEVGIVKIEQRKDSFSGSLGNTEVSISELIGLQIPTEQKHKKRETENP